MAEPCYSVIIPVFNEEKVLPETYSRLTAIMGKLDEDYELIFINDGSSDKSIDILLGLNGRDPHVKVLEFSRNFGHQIAITAGMDHAKGKAVIVIDADLQDPPELIPEFIRKWKEGYEVVYAIREKREGETAFKKTTANIFYRVFNKLSGLAIPVDTGDFRLMDQKVTEIFRTSIREKNRFVRGLVSWVGFRQTGIYYTRAARFAGRTKYPLKKMLKFSVDAIVSFSNLPLRFATYMGFLTAALSFIYLIYVFFIKLFTNGSVQGWSSLIAAVLFLGGVQLIFLGILGEYIARINDEVKERPLYILKKIY